MAGLHTHLRSCVTRQGCMLYTNTTGAASWWPCFGKREKKKSLCNERSHVVGFEHKRGLWVNSSGERYCAVFLTHIYLGPKNIWRHHYFLSRYEAIWLTRGLVARGHRWGVDGNRLSAGAAWDQSHGVPLQSAQPGMDPGIGRQEPCVRLTGF